MLIEGDMEALKEVLGEHLNHCLCKPPVKCHNTIKTQPIRFMPLKFRGLQIAVYATVPDSPSPFQVESLLPVCIPAAGLAMRLAIG